MMRRVFASVWQGQGPLMLICAAILATPAHAVSLEFPAEVLAQEGRSVTPGSYALPLAGFDGSGVPSRVVEGALHQRAYRLAAPDMTTLAILAPLRDQLVADGFAILFECESRACGGFDFRFGTEVIAEPDMHVDIGDFRFLSAERDGEVVSLLVSRSPYAAFVQVTQVTDAPLSPPKSTTTVDLDATETPREVAIPAAITGGIAAALDSDGRAVLDDLVFASGSAALAEGDYVSLAEVAAWLQANPDGTVALVGHTDAAGSLAANVALSERRAETVAAVLVDSFGADRARIVAKGVGFLAPRATNQTDEGRQKNRRVEVVVTSTR